ncbi:MAG: ABC transporter permease [Epsilonproteobacteria bacterium]|nr:ABC transporter permease [Campylobacterota bacterium]
MFKAMIKKEFLLVLRDKQALMVLFIMPAIFILIMSVAMRDIFSQKSVRFDISIRDLDKSSISKELIKTLRVDKSFDIVKAEDAKLSITIPKGYGKEDVANKKKLNINIKSSLKSDEIELFKAKLSKDVISLKLKIIKVKMSEFSDVAASAIGSITLEPKKLFSIKYNKSKNIPNATQQSVPTWIVFSMFFVIIPMSTIYINEKKQNTLARLSSMNISVITIALSKIVPYLFIAQIQMVLMVLVGMYIVPLFNTPALVINGSILALIFLSFALSLCAIGLASLIAASSNSSEQATTIGGISNILLGAIGGVMVPKFIMPPIMQKLADISPMSWGLDGFLDIFLKGGGIATVLNNSIMLILFGAVTLSLSMLILKKKLL